MTGTRKSITPQVSRSHGHEAEDIAVVQGANVADASDLSTAIALANAMKAILIDNGLMADDSSSGS